MKIEGVISLYSESVKLAERSAGLCERDDDHEKANDWREDAKFCKQMIAWLSILKKAKFEYNEAWRIIVQPTPDVTYADLDRARIILNVFKDSLGRLEG